MGLSHSRFEVCLQESTVYIFHLKVLNSTGTSVSVWASVIPRDISISTPAGNDTVPDADWYCLLDGSSSGQTWDRPSGPQSNFGLCSYGSLTDGDHTLELRATVHTETLWVDQVQYQASFDADVSTAWTEVDRTDARYKYSANWVAGPNGYGTATTTNDASFTYEFNGVPPFS